MSPDDPACLSKAMREAGHSLDWGCVLCPQACAYAAPCGCGGAACIDLAVGPTRSGVAAAA